MELKIGMKFYYEATSIRNKIVDVIYKIEGDTIYTKYTELNGVVHTCKTHRDDILRIIEKNGLLPAWEGRFRYGTKSRG